jgi:hypothetical protein
MMDTEACEDEAALAPLPNCGKYGDTTGKSDFYCWQHRYFVYSVYILYIFCSPQASRPVWITQPIFNGGTTGSFSWGVKLTTQPQSHAKNEECVELYLHCPIFFGGIMLNWAQRK